MLPSHMSTLVSRQVLSSLAALAPPGPTLPHSRRSTPAPAATVASIQETCPNIIASTNTDVGSATPPSLGSLTPALAAEPSSHPPNPLHPVFSPNRPQTEKPRESVEAGSASVRSLPAKSPGPRPRATGSAKASANARNLAKKSAKEKESSKAKAAAKRTPITSSDPCYPNQAHVAKKTNTNPPKNTGPSQESDVKNRGVVGHGSVSVTPSSPPRPASSQLPQGLGEAGARGYQPQRPPAGAPASTLSSDPASGRAAAPAAIDTISAAAPPPAEAWAGQNLVGNHNTQRIRKPPRCTRRSCVVLCAVWPPRFPARRPRHNRPPTPSLLSTP
jgi:hypothetical protein